MSAFPNGGKMLRKRGEEHIPALVTRTGRPMTAAEIRRLLTILTQSRHPDEHYLRWSRWRRRHQARAHQSHNQRRQHLRLLPYY